MTQQEYCAWLRREIDKKFGGNVRQAAKTWNIDRGNLYRVLSGGAPFRSLVKATGFEWRLHKV